MGGTTTGFPGSVGSYDPVEELGWVRGTADGSFQVSFYPKRPFSFTHVIGVDYDL